MTVITADDLRTVTGTFTIGPKDRLTPLARDIAAERRINIVVSDSAPVAGGGSASSAISAVSATSATPPAAIASLAAGPATLPVPAGLSLPPSGAMYRRGAPLAAGVSAPAVRAGAQVSTGGRLPVGVVGAGHVGAMTALRLAESNLFGSVTLVDVVPGLAAGLALDMWHGSGLCGFDTRLIGSDDMAALAGCRYIVVTAGRPRQPGMSRTDLTAVNAEIIRSVGGAIRQHAANAVVVVVTNPLEEMTHLMQQVTGFPDERVLGMAGVLDSARFCSLVGLTGKVKPAEVVAYALGSHGPEMVIPLSVATAGGRPLEQLFDAATLGAIIERTRDSGAEVVALLQKGSAYFSPAESAASMVRAMATNSPEVLTACVQSRGAYGLVDTRVGLPVRLGEGGLREIVALQLRPAEVAALQVSAESLASRIRDLG
jgi:malate dehydrogenase